MAIPIVCISAGQLLPKKTDSRVARKNLYLNYGLLSLASVLKRSGFSPAVIHGEFDDPAETFRTAIHHGLAASNHPLLLSIPSFYAVTWARRFIGLLKDKHPEVRVIVGGRWVVGDYPGLLKRHLPGADIIVPDLAEHKILSLVADDFSSNMGIPEGLSKLDYRLLHRREEFQPSIEVSRGCGMGCSFCQESDIKRTALKHPAMLISELKQTLINDQWKAMTPYFEASMFAPSRCWTEQLRQQLELANLRVQWRSEARVDALSPELIPCLAKAGLSVIDLGLESASPRQLLRMRKSKNPGLYLRRASDLLKACGENDIRVKLNILLSPGEDNQSIDETTAWMERHRNYIYGVSAGPVIAYGWPETTAEYLESIVNFGAKSSGSPCLGVTWLDLSNQIDHGKALIISNQICREFMPDRHYYELKSFSYFPRSYSFNDFVQDLEIDRAGIAPNTTAFESAKTINDQFSKATPAFVTEACGGMQQNQICLSQPTP